MARDSLPDRPRSALAALVIAASGCAPSIEGMLRHKHYSEAMLASRTPEHRGSADRVARAIEADLDPLVHVHVVRPEELQRAVGDVPAEIAPWIVLRVRTSWNRLQGVHGVRELVELRSGGEALPVADELESLAAITGEEVPRPRTVTRSTGGGGLLDLFVTLLTLGGVPLPRGTSYTTTEGPTDSGIEARAGKAFHLSRVLRSTGCPRDSRVATCSDDFALWKRPAHPESAPLRFVVTLRVSSEFGVGSAVDVHLRAEIDLPPAPTLEERITRVFGEGERRLSTMGRHEARWP